jgi:hypothetical protein
LRENVQTAEAAGFDYVSIQDHPYVPDYLDTFALIGTLVGETDRLRFMTNVANLPLRPAQMLAKASATLDLRGHGGFTDVELVDLAEVNLPFMNEPHHPRLAQYTHPARTPSRR